MPLFGSLRCAAGREPCALLGLVAAIQIARYRKHGPHIMKLSTYGAQRGEPDADDLGATRLCARGAGRQHVVVAVPLAST